MNGRVDKSMGIVTLIARLVKLKPTEPLRLAKHAARRKRNLSDSSGNSPAKAIASRCACKKSKRTKSFLNKSTSTMMLQGDTGTPSEADLKAFVSLGMDAMLAGGASAVAHLSVDAIRDLTLAVRRKGVTVSQARALHMRLCKPGDKVGATIYMRGGAKGHWAGWDSLTPAAQETLRDIILKHAKASARKGGLKGGGSLAARASLPKARQAAVVVKQAVDMWEALLFTRLAAVASPGGLPVYSTRTRTACSKQRIERGNQNQRALTTRQPSRKRRRPRTKRR